MLHAAAGRWPVAFFVENQKNSKVGSLCLEGQFVFCFG